MERSSWDWIQLFLSEYGGAFLKGAENTMTIALVSTLIGCIIGFAVGIVQSITLEPEENAVKRFLLRFVKLILNVYVEVFRGTPMMVQAMVVYYGSSTLFGWDLDAMAASYLVVSVNTGAYMAETVRGGIMSVSSGQVEASKALGMHHFDTMTRVVLPQALLSILPQICNNLIINIKDTSVLSVISCTELFFVTSSAVGTYYRYFEPFAITCAIYMVLTFVTSRILRIFEKKLQGTSSYQVVSDYQR